MQSIHHERIASKNNKIYKMSKRFYIINTSFNHKVKICA